MREPDHDLIEVVTMAVVVSITVLLAIYTGLGETQ